MDDNSTLSLSEAAEIVGVKPVTFRRWADQHGYFLSAGAHPPVGQARRFDSRDLEVLKTVKAYRDQGISTAIINDRLAGLTFASVIDNEIAEDTTGPGADSTELASVGSQESLQSTQALIVALEAMQRQIDAIQQARQEDRSNRIDTVTAIGLGLCMGLLFAAILIGLAWLYGG
jgi:DNA-binding transcriptional MerR regulator